MNLRQDPTEFLSSDLDFPVRPQEAPPPPPQTSSARGPYGRADGQLNGAAGVDFRVAVSWEIPVDGYLA